MSQWDALVNEAQANIRRQMPPAPRRPVEHITDQRTSALVNEYAGLKVWFATNEVTGPIPAGAAMHRRLCDVVDELRRRGVLDSY